MVANRIVRGLAISAAATVLGIAGMQIATAAPDVTQAKDRVSIDSRESVDSAKKKGKRGPRGKRGFTGKTGPQGPRGLPGPTAPAAFAGSVTGGGMPLVDTVPALNASYVPFGVSHVSAPGYAVASVPMTINNFRLGVLGQVTSNRSWVVWKANGDLKTGVEYAACTIAATILEDPTAPASCTAPALSIAAGQVYGVEFVSGPLTSNPTWSYNVS